MSLEIIIQEIKATGYILPVSSSKKNKVENEEDEQIQEKRKFRISFGSNLYISKTYGTFKNKNQLCFYEPYSFFYDNQSSVLQIQIFKEHQYCDNNDFSYQLNAEVDFSDSNAIKGDIIETKLTDIYGQPMGELLLVVDVFKKGAKYYQKVMSTVLLQEVKQVVERVKRQTKVSAAGKNIKNLIVNQQLSNFLMTINSMHVIPDIEDTEIFNKQCFMMIKYGPNIKIFSKPIKSQVKDSVSFMDYIQFIKADEYKFQFFFMFIDQLNTVVCRARGQIKYIVFDQTINAHSILLFDKKTNKYGVIMVKFIQKETENGAQPVQYKTDKKIKNYEDQIGESIDIFNRYKFQAKYNNHLLSQKMAQIQLQRQMQMQEKNRPMNEEQKKKNQQNKKFVQFLQKEVLRIERELVKREQKNKTQQRKQKYLPNVMQKQPRNSRAVNANMGLAASHSSNEFRQGKVKLPKV